jgi:hypothetical protein
MKILMVLLPPLLLVAYVLWWDRHHRFYETYFKYPRWECLCDLFRDGAR